MSELANASKPESALLASSTFMLRVTAAPLALAAGYDGRTFRGGSVGTLASGDDSAQRVANGRSAGNVRSAGSVRSDVGTRNTRNADSTDRTRSNDDDSTGSTHIGNRDS